jgi:hypothetical protein
MAPLKPRWKLLLGALAVTAVWSALAPSSLLLLIGLLSAFGSVAGWVQYALESAPERPAHR